ncbi:MAG: hypothetical protein AAB368_05940, partial [bacterium]
MIRLARRLTWLALAFLLPAAFMPAALNPFGPVKRDVFFLLGFLQMGLTAVEPGGLRRAVARLSGLPIALPMAAAAAAAGLPFLAAAGSGRAALTAMEGALGALLGLALLGNDDRTPGDKLLSAHAAGVILAAIYGFLQYAGHDPLAWQKGFAGGAPGSTYGNPLFLADGTSAALLWALVGCVASRGTRRAGWGLAAALLSGALVVTRARGAWLGTGLAAAALYLLALRRSPGWVSAHRVGLLLA